MTNYGSSTDLGYLLTTITDSVDSNQKAYALEVADTWVNSLVDSVPSTVPDNVEKAATLYAYVIILRMLYDTAVADSYSASKFEQLAIDLLKSYADDIENEKMSPYSASLTPTSRYMRRNKRTAEDDRDYDNVDNINWESE